MLGTAGLATAAAAVLVLVWSDPQPDPGQDPQGTIAQVSDDEGGGELPPRDPASMSATIEAQFAMLEPGARAKVDRSVDEGRDDLRGELVAAALRADGGTMGGAP